MVFAKPREILDMIRNIGFPSNYTEYLTIAEVVNGENGYLPLVVVILTTAYARNRKFSDRNLIFHRWHPMFSDFCRLSTKFIEPY